MVSYCLRNPHAELPWDEPWDRVNPNREKFPNPRRQYIQIGGFRLGGGVCVWIGFGILDLVGHRMDCMSMVASHGQCYASSNVYVASWTEFGPKKENIVQ